MVLLVDYSGAGRGVMHKKTAFPVRLREIYDHERADPQGIDVSDYQTDIDWTTVVDNGISFVYTKAIEGTSYISPTFNSQYTGATDAGRIRGGYHSAHPDESNGATQADYFLAHGGRH